MDVSPPPQNKIIEIPHLIGALPGDEFLDFTRIKIIGFVRELAQSRPGIFTKQLNKPLRDGHTKSLFGPIHDLGGKQGINRLLQETLWLVRLIKQGLRQAYCELDEFVVQE